MKVLIFKVMLLGYNEIFRKMFAAPGEIQGELIRRDLFLLGSTSRYNRLKYDYPAIPIAIGAAETSLPWQHFFSPACIAKPDSSGYRLRGGCAIAGLKAWGRMSG